MFAQALGKCEHPSFYFDRRGRSWQKSQHFSGNFNKIWVTITLVILMSSGCLANRYVLLCCRKKTSNCTLRALRCYQLWVLCKNSLKMIPTSLPLSVCTCYISHQRIKLAFSCQVLGWICDHLYQGYGCSGDSRTWELSWVCEYRIFTELSYVWI